MSLSLFANSISSSSSLSANNPLQKRSKSCSRVHLSKRVSRISCEQKESHEPHVTDRRNVLLGLGGLCGATTTIASQSMVATGAPIQPPDLSKCNLAVDSETGKKVGCCPPYSTSNIKDFCPPDHWEPLRVRKPAHKLTPAEVQKFNQAIAAMKALDADDPWSYMQQAVIHCTYCNGAYNQVGFNPPVLLQVHESWLFLPWHRYYLYFWERILGKLIGDPTFAIPFWNWDTPAGMKMPEIYYKDEKSPLYNNTRDKSHYGSVLDYKYAVPDPKIKPMKPRKDDEVISDNLLYLHNMFRSTHDDPQLFMGTALSAGQKVPTSDKAAGALELLHNTMHQWVGPPVKPYYDMGNFYTAARDTMFFGHHANVDRMWDIYDGSRGFSKWGSMKRDFLESSFIFYDENRQVVKVKVKDCLTPEDLGYTYSREPLPWKDMSKKTKNQHKGRAKKRSAGGSVQLEPVNEFGVEPRALSEPIRAILTRTKEALNKEKGDATEVLLIDGIEIPHGSPARFDVYVSKPIEGLVGPDFGEFAGSFMKIPHSHGSHDAGVLKTGLQLGLNIVLEDLQAEALEKLVVTLVPRLGEVTVGGIRVDLHEIEEEEIETVKEEVKEVKEEVKEVVSA